MTPTKVHVLAAALLLALALASPAPQDKPLEAAPNQPQHPVHLQKRAAPQDSSPEVRAFPLQETPARTPSLADAASRASLVLAAPPAGCWRRGSGSAGRFLGGRRRRRQPRA